jgi:hypothetical protein
MGKFRGDSRRAGRCAGLCGQPRSERNHRDGDYLESLTVAATISDPAMKSPDGCLSAPIDKLYVAGA